MAEKETDKIEVDKSRNERLRKSIARANKRENR
jgi:hypothetical protein